MTVSFLKHVALEVPKGELNKSEDFYRDFGLETRTNGALLSMRCAGRGYDCFHLVPGNRKRLHHIEMGASEQGLEAIRGRVEDCGGSLITAPEHFSDEGLWLADPHGMKFHIVVAEREPPIPTEDEFKINSPGHYNRIGKGALPPKSTIPPLKPRRLGHTLLFTPDMNRTIEFLQAAFGMRLSDRAQDAVSFLHCQGGSDHHVLALAQSNAAGFHHASFQMGTPDEVGVAGGRMIEKWGGESWGFGRHAIGSNFFHYVRDPWNSYMEYYSDIDYIEDSDNWTAQNWPLEDSLHTWGPNPPADFIHNYEADADT
jgi:catechol 2,3-dioxygenase